MTNELKLLTWKYFWQQKFKEIIIALLIIVALIFVPYFVGHLVPESWVVALGTSYDNPCHDVSIPCKLGFWNYWFGGVLPTILLVAVFFLSRELAKSNWRKAGRRAEEELRRVDEELVDLNQETTL